MKSGKQIFRPKARIIRSLGEELISNEYVAINELVKNSYDAKATRVEIEIFKEKIVISDNGEGMTLEGLRSGWFEPATNSKVGVKSMLGDKGIGRFATVKLAEKLNLKTKAKGHSCINSDFDWSAFNNNRESYLDEININWNEQQGGVLFDSGTTLTLTDLKTDWLNESRQLILRNFLRRMVNPFSDVSDFQIILKINGSEIKISPSEVLEHPHYEVIGSFENGVVNMRYKGLQKNEDIVSTIKQQTLFKCGNFSFVLRVWDRDEDKMRDLATELNREIDDIREDLDAAVGINIYRDKFRVLPYGESNNDWLRLDSRRVNNPSMRLSNNQVVGYISITKEHNSDLIDKVDREGLIDNEAYKAFVDILKDNIIPEIEAKRWVERAPIRIKIEENKRKPFASGLSLKEVKDYVEEKYPEDRNLQLKIAKKEKEISKQGVELGKLILRYRRLSTLGQLLETVIHEINNSFGSASTNLAIIEIKGIRNNQIQEAVGSIRESQKKLTGFIDRLKPFSERNSEKKLALSMKNELLNVIAIKKSELEGKKIGFQLPTTDLTIQMRSVDAFTIFNNLIDNSIYWLSVSELRNRKISVSFDRQKDTNVIIFCDNGPNVPEEYRGSIFDPYFTLKPNGTGLGLSIIGEIVSEYGGQFDFIEEPGCKGAAFKIVF